MNHRISLNDINIRIELKPGDIGNVIYLHGSIYSREYNYGIEFETYVASGLLDFYKSYLPSLDRVWVCEHKSQIIGFLLLIHREDNAAQLRYFIVKPEYRGIGLGGKLMDLILEFAKKCRYESIYLWTTNEQEAASGLYKKYGFRLTEEKESAAFGKSLTEQKYELMFE